MLLSIGLMVKNEEKYLEKCLESLKSLMEEVESELIIIDTGSTDGTVEIAKRYTDKVYFHQWEDNFSKMRNRIIGYSKGEWYLSIDGDEFFEDCNELITFFKAKDYKNYNSGCVKIKNLTSLDDETKFSMIDSVKLFKNEKDFCFKGAIHNQAMYKKPIKLINSTLIHYGYVANDEELMEKKFIRTKGILAKELEKDPNNIYYRFQISVSYAMHKEFERALVEIEKVHKQLQSKGINKENYRYAYVHHAQTLISNKKYSRTIEIAKEAIGVTKKITADKIDIYYYLGVAYLELGIIDDACKSFEEYLNLVDKYEKNEIEVDLSITNNTLSRKIVIMETLILLYFKEKKYLEAIKVFEKIVDEELILKVHKNIIKCCIKVENYELLQYIYANKLKEEKIKIIFLETLEKVRLELDEDICNKINKVFKNNRESYGILNSIRYEYISNNNYNWELESKIITSFEEYRTNFYYGDIVYFRMKNNMRIESILEESNYNMLKQYLIYLNNKYEDFVEILSEYIDSYYNILIEDFKGIRLAKVLNRFLLVSQKLEEDKYLNYILKYIESGERYLKYIYSGYMIENELVTEFKNNEEVFVLYTSKALFNMNNDKKLSIKYLKKALAVEPLMNKTIEKLLELVNKDLDKEEEIKKLKIEFISNITVLMLDNKMDESRILLKEYEDIFGKSEDLELIR